MFTKIFYSLIGIISFLILAFYLAFAPTYATLLHFKGQQISIHRNQYNIPNINAPSRQSYFYAIGRVHAEDRLFQIIFKVLIVQGRLAQFLGEKPLPMDKFMRELNLKGWGKRTAERLQNQNKQEYANFEAYVTGINDYVSSLTFLPFDLQLIKYNWQNLTTTDVFGLFKLLEWSQAMNLPDQFTRSILLNNYTRQEVQKFLPITSENWAFNSTITVDDENIPDELRTEAIRQNIKSQSFSPQILKYYEEIGLFQFYKTIEGSNVFVISGNHTQSGTPYLVHDPHLQNVIPSQWYQIQGIYKANGKQNSISGVSCAGVPFVFGKTDYLALGITTIYMDNQDLYRQKIQGDKYYVNNKWIDLKIREQKIKIKTSNGLIQQVYEVLETHRGPLIHYILTAQGSFKIDQDISLIWTGFNDEYSSVVASTKIAEIKDLQSAKNFILFQTEYMFNVNIAFITKDGHIGYQQLGRYPIRKNPSMGRYIKDGTTTENDWLGFVPPQHRIQIIDPPKGYIVNGNNRIASQKYYNGLHEFTIFTSRSDRLHQLISSKIARGQKFKLEDLKKIVTDTVDSYCKRIKPTIVKLLPESSTQLNYFDCNFTSQSIPAAAYEKFMYNLYHLIKPSSFQKMSVLTFHPAQQYLFNFIKDSVEDEKKVKILKQAWSKIERKQQKWGDFHKDVMHHLPFSNSPLKFLYDREYRGSGNIHTVNVGKMDKVGLGNFETSHRANYRAIYSFTQPSYWIIDSGSSQVFFSRHYDDQWTKFKDNEFIPLRQPFRSKNSKFDSDL